MDIYFGNEQNSLGKEHDFNFYMRYLFLGSTHPKTWANG